MMNISNLKLPLECIANDSEVILIGIRPIYEFSEDGKPIKEKQTGYLYSCICPKNKYSPIEIKTNESLCFVEQTDIDDNNGLRVKPINFIARIYVGKDGKPAVSCRADTIEVVR